MANTLELLNASNISFLNSPPIFLASQATSQAITSGFTGLALTLGTPTIDPYGAWSGGSPTRFTPKVAGWYWVLGGFGYPVNSSGSRVAQLQRNGSTSSMYSTGAAALPTGSFNLVMQTSGFYQMNGSTDYVEMWGYQDSGSTLNTIAASSFLASFHLHS